MDSRAATIIIESRPLVREALESFMASHSYRVVCGVDGASSISSVELAPDEAKLVLLSTRSVDRAVSEATTVRRLWPDSKIVLLLDSVSIDEYRDLMASPVDAFVQLSVSPDTLIDALDLVMTRDIRIMMIVSAERSSRALDDSKEPHQLDTAAEQNPMPRAPRDTVTMPCDQPIESDATIANIATRKTSSTSCLPRLSERETQILDSLVKGHANKVIARTCDITEATVKVHMKSILRKIRVANRTQAAIWALEHGYFGDKGKDGIVKADPVQHLASMM